jgi:preprotein translocase subunit SecD
MENYRSRVWLAGLGVLLSLIWIMPNFVNFDNKWWFTKSKMNYGLDIQGGLHLVMGVDVEGVVRESSLRMTNQLKSEFAQKTIPFADVKSENPAQGEIIVMLANESDKETVKKYMGEHYSSMLQLLNSDGQKIVFRYYDAYLNDYKSRVLQQAVETLRNRIDEFGVAEPSISAQGSDRILVQLPGVKDAEAAKSLINTSARLEFMMVDTSKTPAELETLIADAEKAGNYSIKGMRYTQYISKLNADLKGKLPEKTTLLFEKPDTAATLEAGKIPLLVKTDTDLGGEALDDAFVSFNEYGAPEVSLRFNSNGAHKFSDLTAANVGHSMAIVLDKVVKSAPRINGRIGGGSAVITLGSSRDREKSMAEAKMISMSLRAGALPATLEQLEERTVGPTLGADSIKKAEFAGFLGALIICIFMLLRYRASGVVANITLFINIVMSLALLSSLGATLTLPGIAGIALTIGFAVDSNVLIFERMREELRSAASLKGAIHEGYNKAMTAILDANMMTAATAIILLYFGTGPVKGFAVTLLIGIFTTIFSNVFISKLIMDTLVHKWGWKNISI